MQLGQGSRDRVCMVDREARLVLTEFTVSIVSIHIVFQIGLELLFRVVKA